MTPIAFCERESDLAPMTILRDGDRLVARRRLPEDRIQPVHQTGRFNDLHIHRKSLGRYVRHDLVHDIDLDPAGVPSYDYSSWDTGRLWLRVASEWDEDVGDGPRFMPYEEYMKGGLA